MAVANKAGPDGGHYEDRVCIVELYLRVTTERAMRTYIEIDDALMAEAQKACGYTTKKRTVELALRLMVRLRRQSEADAAFGKYRWRGNVGNTVLFHKNGYTTHPRSPSAHCPG
jgi:Arc/MetJ family transcription regulator